MPLALESGQLIYLRSLGLATAEVYFCEGEFQVYILDASVFPGAAGLKSNPA